MKALYADRWNNRKAGLGAKLWLSCKDISFSMPTGFIESGLSLGRSIIVVFYVFKQFHLNRGAFK